MAHMDLESYFKINFSLITHYHWSLNDINDMIPWEREIYLGLLNQFVEEENLKAQQSS